MNRLIQYSLDTTGQTKILVESSDNAAPRAGQIPVSIGGLSAEKSAEAFDAALAGIKPIAEAVIAQLRAAVEDASEVQVEFGIKLSASAGVILAKASTEGHCKVSVKWSKTK